MATSGYIQTNTDFGYIKLEWTRTSVDVANNQSTISYTYWMHRAYSISSSASKSYSVVFNGSTVASGTTTIGGSGDKTIKTGTVTIPHNSDGTKTFSYSFSQQIDISWGSGYIGTVTGSGSSTLDPIARASKPTLSASTVNYGASVTIYTNRADSSFTHTLRYSWNSDNGTIATGVGTSYAWTVPLNFMNYIPNATASWGTIYCDTYNGSTLIGTTSIRLDTTVPSTVVPTLTSVTASDTATAVTSKAIGSYVQSMSLPKFTANGFAGAYGSTLSKYEFTFESVTYNAGTTNNYTMTTVIKGSGTITVTCKATDSRGRTATVTANLTVLAYAPPVITAFTVQRANSDGTLNDMGTYAKITHNGTWQTLNSKNTVTINTYAKARGTTDWGTAIKSISAGATGSYSGGFTSTQVYDATKSFDFRVDFVDVFGNVTLSINVMSTGLVTMSWGPSGIGIGKVWQSGALDIFGDTNMEGNLNITGDQTLNGDFTLNNGNFTLNNGVLLSKFNAIRLPQGANLNDYWDPGWYYTPLTADAQTMTNTAEAQAFSLFVEKHAGVRQTFTIYYANGWRSYSRNYYSGTWGSWVQTSISTGSTSGGLWFRFGNGLQICWLSTTATNVALTSAYGTGYQGSWRWTYPAAFNADPAVACTELRWGTSASWGTVASKTSTYADLRGMDFYSRASGTTTYISAIAIGSW